MASGRNYYNSKQIGNVEVVTLVHDIPLPSYDKKLTASMVKQMYDTGTGSFTPITTAYKAMKADFYINIETPNLDTKEKIIKQQAAPRLQQGGNRLNTESYSTGNTIRLEIPKYLVMMFDNKIPKGTKFLIASLADKVDTNNIRIISLYNSAPSQIYNDDAESTVMGGGR